MAGYKDALNASRKLMGEPAPVATVVPGEEDNKDLKKTEIADIVGVNKKDLNDKTLIGIHDAAKGAEKVAAQGVDPTKLDYAQLRAEHDPEALKKEKPADLGKQQMLFQSIIGILPTVLGYAIGGEQGGATGAQIGAQGVKDVGNYYADEENKQIAQAKAAKEDSYKQKEFGYKDKELALKAQELARNSSKDAEQSKLIGAKIDYYGKKGVGGANGLASQRFENQKSQNIISGEDRMRDDYLKNAVVQNYQKASEGVNKLKELEALPNPSSASDMELIYAFMKAQDPGSVVRESEYATANKYAGSLYDSYGIKLDRILGGKDMLTPDQRHNLISAGKAMLPAYEKPYSAFAQSFQKTAQTRGYNPESILMSYQGQAPGAAPAPANMSREQKIQLLKQMGHK